MTAESKPMEYVGDITFKGENITPESSLEDWLEQSQHEYLLSRAAAVYLNMDDQELSEHLKEYGETEEERTNHLCNMVETFKVWANKYEAGNDVMRSVVARLIVIGERWIGQEVVEDTYRNGEG